MAIQTIDTGVDVGLKVGADKYNANFTDSTNMASKLAQTSPADATADRGLTTETTHLTAGVLYTGANYQPDVSQGVGVVRLMQNNSGGNIADQQQVSGTNLLVVFFVGSVLTASIAGIGTWKMVSGTATNCANGNTREFVRTA